MKIPIYYDHGTLTFSPDDGMPEPFAMIYAPAGSAVVGIELVLQDGTAMSAIESFVRATAYDWTSGLNLESIRITSRSFPEPERRVERHA